MLQNGKILYVCIFLKIIIERYLHIWLLYSYTNKEAVFMKKCISIVMAIMFLISSLPTNAVMQVPSDNLLSRIESFNEEAGISADAKNSDKVNAEEKSEEQILLTESKSEALIPLDTDDTSDVSNYEEEIIETIPVEDNTPIPDGKEVTSDSQNDRYKEIQKAYEAKKRLELLESSDNEDWYAEDFVFADEDNIYYDDDASLGLSFDSIETEAEAMAPVYSDASIDSSCEYSGYEESIDLADGSLSLQASGEDASASASVGAGTATGSTSTAPLTCKVSGSVTLPANAQIAEGSIMYIYAFKAPVFDETRVIKEHEEFWSRRCVLNAGTKAISFKDVSLPAGDYIFGIEFMTGNKAIIGQMYYYTENGSVMNPYAADIVSIEDNTTDIDLVIPEAESYISGTLDLSEFVSNEAYYITIDTYNWNNGANPDCNKYFTSGIYVPTNAEAVDYEIAVAPGTYCLDFYSETFGYKYYSSGKLVRRSKQQSHISAEEAVTGLDAVVTKEDSTGTDTDEDGDAKYEEYSITINFANPAECDKAYAVALIERNGYNSYIYDYNMVECEEGNSTITTEFFFYGNLAFQPDFHLAYREIANEFQYNVDGLFHYYSDSLGVSANIDDADIINGNYDIVVNEPETVSITGDITADSELELTGNIYVGADFDDGIYYDLTSFEDGSYTINIPERYVGESFYIFTAKDNDGYIDDSNIIYTDEEYTLADGMEVDAYAGEYITAMGNIYLPHPAPESGAYVEIGRETFAIMPGEESIEYKYPMIPSSTGNANSYAYLYTYEPFGSTRDAYINSLNNFEFEETVTISGTVSLPQDLSFDEDINFNIVLEGNDYSSSNYSILAGESEVSYKVQYPKNYHLDNIRAYCENYDDAKLPIEDVRISVDEEITEDTSFDMEFTKAKTISGTISLPEGAEYDGGEFEYRISVEDEEGYSYDSYNYTSDPTKPIAFSINVPSDSNSKYRLRVYAYDGDSNGDTCIATHTNIYYVSDYVMSYDINSAAMVEADSVCHLYFPLNRKISGTVKFPEGAFSTGDFRVEFYAENPVNYDSRWSINEDVTFPNAFNYNVYIPKSWEYATLRMSIYQNDKNSSATGTGKEDYEPIKTNVSLGEFYYNNEYGFVTSDASWATPIDVRSDASLKEFTIPKATKVTGKFIFPDDYVSDREFKYAELSFEPVDTSSGDNYSYTTAFSDDNGCFEAYVPAHASGEYYIVARKPWDISSNILNTEHYYRDETGRLMIVDVTSGNDISGIEIEYETGYALYGTITLPEDAYISKDTIVEVGINYYDAYSNILFDSETKTGKYILGVPKDTATSFQLNINVYAWCDIQGKNPDTNVCTGNFCCYSDGTLTMDYAEPLAVENDTEINIELISGFNVPVTVKRPADSYSDIWGYLYIESENGDSIFRRDMYLSLYNGSKKCTGTFTIPKEYANKEFYVYYYLYSGDVYTNGSVYINSDGSFSKTKADAVPHKLDSTSKIEFTLGTQAELAKTITGTISFEDGCEMPANTSYTLYVNAYNSSYGYAPEQRIVVSSIKDYKYKIILPDYNYSWKISVSIYANGTNICSETIYYTSVGITTSSYYATNVAPESTNIDIVIPRLSKISGKIIVDEDYKYLEKMETVNIFFRNSSTGQETGTVVSLDENLNYVAYLPYNYTGNVYVGARITDPAMNNLVKNTTYWLSNYYSIPHGTDVQNVNIAVETGYAVSGILKLPQDVTLTENASMTYNLEMVNSNTHVYLNFDSKTSERVFMFGIPKNSRYAYYFRGSASIYSNTPVNVFMNEVYYDINGKAYYAYESNLYFAVTEDIEDIEITMPKGLLVNIELDGPSNTSLNIDLGIESTEGYFTNRIYHYYNNSSKNAWTVLREDFHGMLAMLTYYCDDTTNNSEYYIPWNIYLGDDRKFYGDVDSAGVIVLSDANTINIKIPKPREVIYPKAILESPHPYTNDMNKTYTYTYPGEADSLLVTFSDKTETEGCDYIYITDANGNEVGYYSGNALAGRSISIPGNSFTIRLETDYSNVYYGFAITEIVPHITHTVTFKNYDGTVIQTSIVNDGQDAEYYYPTPTREADGDKKYRFKGWDKPLTNITEDTEFTAQFDEVIIYIESPHNYSNNFYMEYPYTYNGNAEALRITFSELTETESGCDFIRIYNSDGTPQGTYSGTQLMGKSVTVTGNSFKIIFDTDYSNVKYGFEVIAITPVKEFYTVTFNNYDGTELYKVTVPAGTDAQYYGDTPVRFDDEHEYVFDGWDKDTDEVYEDLIVTAQFKRITYATVSYYNYDGTLLYTDRVITGEESEYMGPVPYRPIDDRGIGYVFDGWSENLYAVYNDTSVTAQFTRKSVNKVSTEAQLRAISENPDGVYVLQNDIELTEEWIPVYTFKGVFDGNGHTIKNITFDIGTYNNTGFFNSLESAVIRNLTLEANLNESNAYSSCVAPLAASISYSDIRNVHTKGSINITGSFSSASGFADDLNFSYVDGCSANVDISASDCISGFSSVVYDTDISNCYYNGTITATSDSAYIVGFAEFGEGSESASTLDSCYSNAKLITEDDISPKSAVPFASTYENENHTSNYCYYNKDSFALNTPLDDMISLGTGLTSEEMKNKENFIGFDFDMMWEIASDGSLVLSAAGGKICNGHTFSEWQLISEADCENAGVSTRTCSKCGRIERKTTPAFGHSHSEWSVTKEPSVLSEGEKSRQCSVCKEIETIVTQKLSVDADDPNYGLVHFNVVDAISLEALQGVQIFISTDNDGENTFFTDDEGKLTQYLPIGIVNVSLYKKDYLTRTIKIDVKHGEQSVPTIGISTKPLVEAKLTSELMDMEDIINAGIDINAPGNNHVVKYNVTLTFGTESANLTTYFNGNHTCVGNTRIPVHISTGTVYVYPVSENFYLMVYGEVQWLKEMFDVEMLIMNNSNTDTVTECSAELTLPDGLSLAEMLEGEQSLKQDIEDIGHSESRSVHWYVRGDKAGEYNIGAKLKAVLLPHNDVIEQNYTLEEPIKVYAGNAMHMDIYVPDMTFYGDSYPIRIELTNVSDRTLYNVSNSIKYFKEGKVTHYSNGAITTETYFTKDNLASIGSSEFKPGDKITIEVQADVEFRTSLIKTGLSEIKKYVNNIDILLNAYDAYLSGAKTVNESYLSLIDIKNKMHNVILTKAYEGTDKEISDKLYNAVSEFADVLKVCESQKALELFNKLKTTGVYKLLNNICEKGDVFASYKATRITKYVNTINSIIKSENIAPANAVNEEMLFDLLKRAIESIPVKYYLGDVLVSTLAGSTTSIPYTIHRVSSDERFSSIERLDSYLNSVIETAIDHIDAPWLMSVLDDGHNSYNDSEEIIFTAGKVNKFAANDNKGDIEFKVWTDSSALEISSTNETSAVDATGALTFTGPGYISVVAGANASGTLYISMAGDVREYKFTTVDAHTCISSDGLTIVSPDSDTDGYKLSYCSICHSIMSVDKHEAACENHVFGDYIIEMDANGEELGIKKRVCRDCGHIQYLVIDEDINYMEFNLTPESQLEITEKATGEGSYLKKIVAGVTAEQLTSNFDFNNTSVEVVKADGTVISATNKIGTGSKLKIKDEDGTTESELTVIVKGDTSGDGDVNVVDMIRVFNHILHDESPVLSGDYVEAAYINDDKNINIIDFVRLFKAILYEEVLR